MTDSSQLEYRTTELDPGLLSTPFEVETKWHVITGAACCGKTTLIDLLAEKGSRTVAETAREYFDREMAAGRTLAEICEDMGAVELCIHDLQLRAEGATRPDEVAFLDRALPDCLSFARIFGMNPDDLLPDCLVRRYASVLLLDRLPLQRDTPLGPEDEASAAFLDEWLVRDYSALGYRVVRVPVLSPQERLAFVLERLFEGGLNQALDGVDRPPASDSARSNSELGVRPASQTATSRERG